MSHIHPGRIGSAVIPRSTFYNGPFGRLFSKLPPWEPCNTGPGSDPVATIQAYADTEMFPAPDAGPDDHPTLPAGYTYFGQFIDHDITFDPTSSLERQNDPNLLRNFRTPRLDLDCLYGEGPDDEPFMYDGSERFAEPNRFRGYFLLGANPDGDHDLPRNSQGSALIGDMRNDENSIVSQFQLAMLKLHNRILGAIVSGNPDAYADPACGNIPATHDQFREAQRLLRWFYQYVVWNDFVKRIVPDDIWQSIFDDSEGIRQYKGLFYRWRDAPYIPVEFSVAAYRFGHSLVRPGYKLNQGFTDEKPIFDLDNPGHTDADGIQIDLAGFRNLPKGHAVDWRFFVDFGDNDAGFPQKAQRIDARLDRSVFRIPGTAGPGETENRSLATLNILRGFRMQLPSGPAVARAMGIDTPLPSTADPCASGAPVEEALWVYILREAGSGGGATLGKVGGRIVAEVFGGLLSGDPLSYVCCFPKWTPAEVAELLGMDNAPLNGGDRWELADLLRAAGVA